MAKETASTPTGRKPKAFGDTRLARMEWEATHADLESHNIIIHEAFPIVTQYGDAYVCKVQVGEDTIPVLMGGQVLVDQITTIADDLPVACRVEKPTHYYLLVEAVE